MKVVVWSLAGLMFALGACEPESEPADEPEPVTPVEVGEEDEVAAETGTEDVIVLQARIAELERQLTECRGEEATAPTPTPSGTQVATVPEGVDVPEDTATPAQGSGGTSSRRSSASGRRRGARREPGLLGALLGEPDSSEQSGSRGRRRSGGNDSEGDSQRQPTLLDPARVLLGE